MGCAGNYPKTPISGLIGVYYLTPHRPPRQHTQHQPFCLTSTGTGAVEGRTKKKIRQTGRCQPLVRDQDISHPIPTLASQSVTPKRTAAARHEYRRDHRRRLDRATHRGRHRLDRLHPLEGAAAGSKSRTPFPRSFSRRPSIALRRCLPLPPPQQTTHRYRPAHQSE